MSFFKAREPELPPTATGVKQTIQARHATATFVPKGHTIKIINTYGKQVVDTWAFALHAAPTKEEWAEDNKEDEEEEGGAQVTGEQQKEDSGDGSQVLVEKENEDEQSGEAEERKEETEKPASEKGAEEKEEPDSKKDPKSASDPVEQAAPQPDQETTDQAPKKEEATAKGWSSYIPSVRGRGKQPAKDSSKPEGAEKAAGSANKGWSSYLPSVGGGKRDASKDGKDQSTWSSYMSSGQGFSSYIPKDTISSFTSLHQRDPTKSVAEQLYDFSKTPVGAAGISVASGSGYASSIYAAYTAYSQGAASKAGANVGMEYMSMPHTHASTKHLSPKVGDTLVTNLRAPILTLVEDTSPGVHDTVISACDPLRYRELGVKKWEEHGSCAENLVLTLGELNQRIGLKGRKAIGCDIAVNNVPAPLNLFMNVPWNDAGELAFSGPKGKRGDYVKFRAERDAVVVMSSCPNDVQEHNGGKIMVAHFVVGSPSEEDTRLANERDSEAQRIIEKARLRTEAEKSEPKAETSKSRPAASREISKPVPSRQPSSAQPSSAAPRPPIRQGSSRGPPRKLDRSGLSRRSSQASSVPRKESQRIEESPPPPTPPKPKQPVREGRPKPRKLQRRNQSSASTPTAA